MRFWLKLILILFFLALVAGGAAYVTERVMRSRYGPPPDLEVRVEAVSPGSLAETVSAPGVVQPRRNVKISAKVSARIVAIPVKEGERVNGGDAEADPPVPGTVLVRLDDRDLRSRLRAARANRNAMMAQVEVERATLASQTAELGAQEATLVQLGRDLERKQALRDTRDVSQALLDEVRTRWEEQNARLEAARLRLQAATHNLDVLRHRIEGADADIEQAEEALEYTVIRSPIDGTVTTLNAEVGEMVVTGTMNNAGTVILEVADLDSMILVAEVDESDVGKVQPGQDAVIHVQAYPEVQIDGVVDNVALTHRTSGRGSKYYRTEIRLAESPVTLYSGLTANVDIRTRVFASVLTVPSQAVVGRRVDDVPVQIRGQATALDTDKTYATVVYRVLAGKSVITPVEIGPADMTRTVITQGLEPGDQVVIGPYKVLNTLEHDRRLTVEIPSAVPAAPPPASEAASL